MSIADSFTFVVVNENSGSSDNNLAPLYVMKGALRELNDRYTKLQTRISYLEDENLRLKNSLKKEAVLSEDNGKNGFDLTGKIGGSYARGENLWAKGFLSSKDKSQALSNFTTSRDSFDYPMSKQMSSSVLKSEGKKYDVSLILLCTIIFIGVWLVSFLETFILCFISCQCTFSVSTHNSNY